MLSHLVSLLGYMQKAYANVRGDFSAYIARVQRYRNVVANAMEKQTRVAHEEESDQPPWEETMLTCKQLQRDYLQELNAARSAGPLTEVEAKRLARKLHDLGKEVTGLIIKLDLGPSTSC